MYPRPSIQLEVSTKTAPTVVDQTTPAGAAGSAIPTPPGLQSAQPDSRTREIQHPENVYFYSLVGEDYLDDNVDSWPTVAECDYALVPEPQKETRVDSIPGDRDRQMPDASPIPWGHSRYTHDLVPISDRTNIIAGRAPDTSSPNPETTLGAYITNVTVSRAIPPEQQSIAPLGKQSVVDIRNKINVDILSALQQAENNLLSAFAILWANCLRPAFLRLILAKNQNRPHKCREQRVEAGSRRPLQPGHSVHRYQGSGPDVSVHAHRRRRDQICGQHRPSLRSNRGQPRSLVRGLDLSATDFRDKARQGIEQRFAPWRAASGDIAQFGSQMSKQYRSATISSRMPSLRYELRPTPRRT